MSCLCWARTTRRFYPSDPVARHRFRSIALFNVRPFSGGGVGLRNSTASMPMPSASCLSHSRGICGTIWDSGRGMRELAQLALVRYPPALRASAKRTQDLEALAESAPPRTTMEMRQHRFQSVFSGFPPFTEEAAREKACRSCRLANHATKSPVKNGENGKTGRMNSACTMTL